MVLWTATVPAPRHGAGFLFRQDLRVDPASLDDAWKNRVEAAGPPWERGCSRFEVSQPTVNPKIVPV